MAGMTKPRRSGARPLCCYGRLTYRSTSVGMSEQWGTP